MPFGVLVLSSCAQPDPVLFKGFLDLPVMDGAEIVECPRLIPDDHNFEHHQVCLELPAGPIVNDVSAKRFYSDRLARRDWVQVNANPGSSDWAWPVREPAEVCLLVRETRHSDKVFVELMTSRFKEDWSFRKTCEPE